MHYPHLCRTVPPGVDVAVSELAIVVFSPAFECAALLPNTLTSATRTEPSVPAALFLPVFAPKLCNLTT